ncbi:hypothetical protein T439DRAFT_327634 [Meredithblackwellia eburnea MCA 4105]
MGLARDLLLVLAIFSIFDLRVLATVGPATPQDALYRPNFPAPTPFVGSNPQIVQSNTSSGFVPRWGKRSTEKRQNICLGSTATDATINQILAQVPGDGIKVFLCPGAVIFLQNPVFFTAANQELSTLGYPTDATRATIVVAGASQSIAVYGVCNGCDGVALRNIQIKGSRDILGFNNGYALLEMGGPTSGQVIDHCVISEPRGWSCLHEGSGLTCTGMTITNNIIGPCGNSPTNGFQFKRDLKERDNIYPPSEWADGISLACRNSLVQNNVITDATDGGIVIFQAPGSLITGNTVVAVSRVGMGGINMVDYAPYGGSYAGTIVAGNTIVALSTMIKVGIAIGPMVWGSNNQTAVRTSGGLVFNNVLNSGPFGSGTGYFYMGIAVAGHIDATVVNNDATFAWFGGQPYYGGQVHCFIDPPMQPPQAFIFDQYTSPGYSLQSNFYSHDLVFLICPQPGPIIWGGALSSNNGIVIGVQRSVPDMAPPSAPSSSSSSSTPTQTSTPTSSATSATGRDQASLQSEISVRRVSQASLASVAATRYAAIASLILCHSVPLQSLSSSYIP